MLKIIEKTSLFVNTEKMFFTFSVNFLSNANSIANTLKFEEKILLINENMTSINVMQGIRERIK